MTRIDACIDVQEEDYFDSLYRPMIDRGVQNKFPIDQAGDWHTHPYKDGRTLYIGNRKNRSTLLRMYEKGKQLGTTFDWVRVEVEYHPKKSSADKTKRLEALYMTPEEVFTHNKKMNNVTKLCLLDLEYKYIMTTPHRPPSDYETALVHMTKQYGAVISRYLDTFEDDHQVVTDLRARIAAPF